MEMEKLYIKNSIPLERIEELVVDEEYFNEEGHCLKFLGNDVFEFVKRSPLISGELLSGLESKHMLKTFWVLAKNM